MQRCLDLAQKAEGYTYPNPLVGSVIVHNGRIIGEGYHLRAEDLMQKRSLSILLRKGFAEVIKFICEP